MTEPTRNKPLKLYGISNCDTVKRARRWLDAQGVDYQFHDFRKDGIDTTMINHWLNSAGPDKLLNKRSTTWKKLDPAERENLSGDQIPSLLASHPTLIKRPVLETAGHVLVGFSDASYRTFFSFPGDSQ